MTADLLAPLAANERIATAAAKARSAVDELLSHRVLRRRSAEVTAESALRAARASAALDGEHMELERLRGLLIHGTPVEHPYVEASVRLHAGLGDLVEVWKHSPSQALARLHVLAAAGLAPEDDLGRPRTLPLSGSPTPIEVAVRLEGMTRFLLDPTVAPAVVVAAIVHGELLALRPFVIANGLVARAASRLTLIARGVDPKACSAPEVGHWELHETYPEALEAYEAGDVETWVEHCAAAIELGALEGRAICEALQRET